MKRYTKIMNLQPMELAEFLASDAASIGGCNRLYCKNYTGDGKCTDHTGCARANLNWLMSEVTEEDGFEGFAGNNVDPAFGTIPRDGSTTASRNRAASAQDDRGNNVDPAFDTIPRDGSTAASRNRAASAQDDRDNNLDPSAVPAPVILECRHPSGSFTSFEDDSDGCRNEESRGDIPQDDRVADPIRYGSVRMEILSEAIKCVCTDRNGLYGEPEDNFSCIAEWWKHYLTDRCVEYGAGVCVTPEDVAMMMVLFKLARYITAFSPSLDTFIDMAGYAACAGEIALRSKAR